MSKSLATRPSPTHLLTAPLPQLLAEVGATLVESSITDEAFLGAVVVDRGRVVLSMPAGRPDAERDLIARGLLGNALGVDLAPLPAPLRMEELAGV